MGKITVPCVVMFLFSTEKSFVPWVVLVEYFSTTKSCHSKLIRRGGVTGVTISAKASRGVIGMTTSAKHPEGSLVWLYLSRKSEGSCHLQNSTPPFYSHRRLESRHQFWSISMTLENQTLILGYCSLPVLPSLTCNKIIDFCPTSFFYLYMACVHMYVCGHTCVHIHGGLMLILENPPLSLFDLFHWYRVSQSNWEPTVWLIFLTSLLGIRYICLPRLELHTGHCIRPLVLKPV